MRFSRYECKKWKWDESIFIIKIFVENISKCNEIYRCQTYLLFATKQYNNLITKIQELLVVINVAIFDASIGMTLLSGSYRAALISTETSNGLLNDNYYNAEAYSFETDSCDYGRARKMNFLFLPVISNKRNSTSIRKVMWNHLIFAK